MYKIISKLITLRLRPVMQSIISDSQTAFIKGRLISDNALVALEGFHSMRTDKSAEGHFDRIEWNFLEKVLIKLGFDQSWVSKVLHCVRTPSFSFKINGSIVGFVAPTRGIRQGDPLSPYLFIICAEVLSSLLQSKVRDGSIHGLKVCRQAPTISHLFFADDCLIFGRANPSECAQVTDAFSLYERASGQKINYAKTDVAYSKSVNCTMRDQLTRQLGVTEVDSHVKYLGFPTDIGRSKVQTFSFLKDRIWKKLNGWDGDNISKAGKEVLIKSVLQSASSYVMSVYHIPVSLFNEIHGMIARFWWGGTDLKRTVHWKSWSFLCLPKNLGGLGFRDLKAFNIALLGKQGWRLLTYPDALVSRVLKARYFPRSDFIGAEIKTGSSYSWSSIMHSQEVLKKGIYWCIGDGKTAQISSSWIPDGHRYKKPQIISNMLPATVISALFDAESMAWDVQRLRNTLQQSDVDKALNLPLLGDSQPDTLAWWPDKGGNYTVRSAYWLLTCDDIQDWEDRIGGTNVDIWRVIWRVKLPHKIRNFAWRLCSNVADLCSRCNMEAETDWHHLILCVDAQEAWEGSPVLPWLQGKFSNPITNVILDSFHVQGYAGVKEFLTRAWISWTARNKKIFDQDQLNVPQLRGNLLTWVDDYAEVQQQRTPASIIQQQGTREVRWVKPRMGHYKINSDACVINGSVGIGIACQNDWGRLVLLASKSITNCEDVLLGEAMACLWGLQLGLQYGYFGEQVETDCQPLVKKILSTESIPTYTGKVIASIRSLASQYLDISFSHIDRSCNSVAHLAARLCFSYSNSDPQVLNCNYPQGILDLVGLDII